jgi:hypothetical protein
VINGNSFDCKYVIVSIDNYLPGGQFFFLEEQTLNIEKVSDIPSRKDNFQKRTEFRTKVNLMMMTTMGVVVKMKDGVQ